MTARIRMFGGLLALGFVASLVGTTRADDKAVKFTGTYSFKTSSGGRSNREVTHTLKFKQEGEKVTGKWNSKDGELVVDSEFKEGTVKDGVLSFSITRELNGNRVPATCTARLEGDTLRFNAGYERNGQKVVREFEAKRESDKP
jgi:hypothetical protein